jgi:hypothetical protein
MITRAFGYAAFGGLATLASAVLLLQLSQRADTAADTVSAIRRDGRSVTALLDRGLGAGVLGVGWDRPVLGRGAMSTAQAAYLVLPTSTAAGDLDLTLVLDAGNPALRDRPVTVLIGPTPIGTWTPKTGGEETIRLVIPRAARTQSYEVTVMFDLTGGRASPVAAPPIRIVSASTRVSRPS